jgi:hypothetical protein
VCYFSKITLVHTHSEENSSENQRTEDIELLPHPTFSPDLEPPDYYLFHSMAWFLHGKKFQSVVDVEVAVEDFFKEWFYQAFKELAEKWVNTIEHEGLYFEY